MRHLVADIPNCAANLDNVITGANEEKHLAIFDRAQTHVEEYGFKCNLPECTVLQDSVTCLNY